MTIPDQPTAQPTDLPTDAPLDRAEATALLDAERARLDGLAESLQETFDDIVETASDVATDDEHDPEGHTIAFERQQQAGLLADVRRRLAGVEAAAQRVADGAYDVCVSCGGTIPPERLRAMPLTDRCVACVEPTE